jgi:hypothetical protein
VETTQSVSITIAKPAVDVTAPVSAAALTPSVPGAGGWYTSAVTAAISASDDLSGVAKTEYQINSVAWTVYTGPIILTSDGSYTLAYRSTDAAGNVEAAKSLSFKLDKAAPVTTAVVNPTTTPSATDVTVTLTATDVTSGVAKTEYQINSGAWTVYTSPVVLTNDGSYALAYRSTDAAGNVEATQSVSITIAKPAADVTAPESAAALTPSVPGAGGWYTSAVTAAISASDDLSGVAKTEYQINSGAWTVYTGPVVLTNDGSYILAYRSTDAAGNVEAAKSLSFKLDKATPITTAAVNPTTTPSATNVTVTLTATDVTSGVAKTEYQINSGAWTVYTGLVVLTNDGSYTLAYRSTDAAGNVETTKSVSITIAKPAADVTAPVTNYTLSPVNPTGANGWYLDKVGITLLASDNMTGVAKTEYRINNGTWKVYTVKFYSSASDGIYLIEYRSTDKAGNVEPIKSMQIKIDKTAPTSTYKFNKLPNGTNGWYSIKVYFYLTPKDNVSGVTLSEYRINGGTWTTYTDVVALLTDGVFTIEYRSTDAAGNVQTSAPIGVKIDKTVPVTTATVTTATIGGKNVTLTATDSTSGISKTEYRVNAGVWITYSGLVNFNNPGSYTVEYLSTDMAGNLGVIKNVTFTN